MQKWFFIILILSGTATGFSQRRAVSGVSIDITAGYAGTGIIEPIRNGAVGYFGRNLGGYIGKGIESYIVNGGGAMISCNYHLNKWSYFELSASGILGENRNELGNDGFYNLYNFQLGYFRQLWEEYSFRRYALDMGGGISFGHEILRSDKDLANGTSLKRIGQSIYGIYWGAIGEIRLGGDLLLVVKGYGYYPLNAELGHFYPYIGAGIRYFLF